MYEEVTIRYGIEYREACRMAHCIGVRGKLSTLHEEGSILTGLVEVAAKGISTDQFYKISHTMDLIDNFLADRNNNLIEDNEYENTLNASLTNSINDSVTSTKSELEIVNGLIGSLDTRMGLLGTAVQNAVALSTYARNVLEARVAICADFAKTYFNHVR